MQWIPRLLGHPQFAGRCVECLYQAKLGGVPEGCSFTNGLCHAYLASEMLRPQF